MGAQLKEPKQMISPYAIKYWRLTTSILYFILLCVVGVLYVLKSYYEWPEWWDFIFKLVTGFLFLSFIIEFFYVPNYKQKTWRYEINSSHIILKYGRILKINYKIIPLAKVYYVHIYQHPLLKKYNLASVKIGTLAYVHEIPALPEKEAYQIRQLISELSNFNYSDQNMKERNING
jgi:uncharacterized protein